MNPQMLDAALATYAKVAGLTSALAVAIFTARLSILASTVSSPNAFADALKSLVAFFISLALAPVVFKAIVFSTGNLAEHIGRYASVATQETSEKGGVFSDLMKLVSHDSPMLSFILSVIPFSVSHLASSVYSILLGSLCAATPIILLYFELSNSSQSLRAVATSVLVLSSWPILWNIMGLLAHELWPSFSHTTVATFAFWAVVKFLQLVSPVISVLFFKSLSMTGVSKVREATSVVAKFKNKGGGS